MSNVYQVLNKCTVKITDLNLPLEISLPHCDKTIFYDFIARTTFFSVALNFLQLTSHQISTKHLSSSKKHLSIVDNV